MTLQCSNCGTDDVVSWSPTKQYLCHFCFEDLEDRVGLATRCSELERLKTAVQEQCTKETLRRRDVEVEALKLADATHRGVDETVELRRSLDIERIAHAISAGYFAVTPGSISTPDDIMKQSRILAAASLPYGLTGCRPCPNGCSKYPNYDVRLLYPGHGLNAFRIFCTVCGRRFTSNVEAQVTALWNAA